MVQIILQNSQLSHIQQDEIPIQEDELKFEESKLGDDNLKKDSSSECITNFENVLMDLDTQRIGIPEEQDKNVDVLMASGVDSQNFDTQDFLHNYVHPPKDPCEQYDYTSEEGEGEGDYETQTRG